MRKRQDDKFDRLLKVAQVMSLLQGPQQQAQGQKLSAALQLLGLTQQDRNAKEDREFRGKEGEATRAHTSAEAERSRAQAAEQFIAQLTEAKAGREQQGSIANRGLANQERQTENQDKQFGQKFLLDKDILGHTKEVDAEKLLQAWRQLNQGDERIGMEREQMGNQKEYQTADLDIKRGALANSKEGQTLSFFSDMSKVPGADIETLFEGSGNETLKGLGQMLKGKRIEKVVNSQLPLLRGAGNKTVANDLFNQMPVEAQQKALQQGGFSLGDPSQIAQDLMPASMTGGQPSGPMPANLLQAAGVVLPDPALGIPPYQAQGKSLRELLFGNALDLNSSGIFGARMK